MNSEILNDISIIVLTGWLLWLESRIRRFEKETCNMLLSQDSIISKRSVAALADKTPLKEKWISGNNVLFPWKKVTCIRCYAGYSLVLFDNGVEVKLDSNASADKQINTFIKDINNDIENGSE